MANLIINLESVCAGGGHSVIGMTVNGGAKRLLPVDTAKLTEVLTDEEMMTVMPLLVRMHAIGKTPAQVKANLNAPIQVTI